MHPHTPRVVATLAIVALAAACSSGGSTATKPPVPKVDTRVDAKPGTVTVQAAGLPVELPSGDRDAIVAAVGNYVTEATLRPLDGHPSKDLTGLLSTQSADALTGPNGDTFSDLGVPPAKGKVTVTLTPVDLTALADRTAKIDLVGATVDLTVQATTAQGPVAIHRTGELMYTRQDDGWKILGFQLAVTRDGAGIDAAAASTSSTTGTTP